MALSLPYRRLCLPAASASTAGLLPALTHPRSTQLFSKATQKLNPSTSENKTPPEPGLTEECQAQLLPSSAAPEDSNGDATVGTPKQPAARRGVVRLWSL